MEVLPATSQVWSSWLAWLRRAGLSERRLLWMLLGASLAVRLAAWGWTAGHDVPLRGDEHAYFARALAYADAMRSLAGGHWPDQLTWARAYGFGKWPPLQPILLALGLVVAPSVAVARLVVAIVSAATTPVVYLLARQMASRRAALIAAAMHVAYPTFVAYAHFLWAESGFMLVLCLSLLCALRSRDAASGGARLRRCAAAGGLMGAAFLFKTSAIVLMPAIPLWLCARDRFGAPGRRAALAFVAAWLVPWGGWSLTASAIEGRFIPTMTNAGYGLYLGNNPWMPAGVGTFDSKAKEARMDEAISELSERTGVAPDVAARRLALEEIAGRPGRFVARTMRRAQELWMPDSFLLQHQFRGYYPPIPLWLGGVLVLLVAGSYLALVVLAARGLLIPGSAPLDLKLLWLGCVVLMMVPPLLVVARGRYHVPSLVILLPCAAMAIDQWRTPLPRRRLIAWAVGAGAFLVICAEGLPNWIRLHIQPSSRYAALVRPLEGLVGLDIRFVDWLAFRVAEGAPYKRITFTALGEGAAFDHSGRPSATWQAGRHGPIVQDYVYSRSGDLPLRVALTVDGGPAPAAIVTVHGPGAWRRWTPTGVPGVEYCWQPPPRLAPHAAPP